MFILPKKNINNIATLQKIKNICFTAKDLRAGWIGEGIPETNVEEFKPFARWATQHLNMYLTFVEYIKEKGKKNMILDVGCGIGHSSFNIASLFQKAQIIALDMDEEAIRFAQKYNEKSNIQYVYQDFFKFDSNQKFSYIFALEILEHIPSTLHYLFIDKCLSLLQEGGKLFITTPNGLDEKDSAYGHIGFLNRKRAPEFFERYKHNIIVESFIDNKRLLDTDFHNAIVKSLLKNFSTNSKNKSHFRIVLIRNKMNYKNINANWQITYFIFSHLSNAILRYRRTKDIAGRYIDKAFSIKSYKRLVIKVYRKVQ